MRNPSNLQPSMAFVVLLLLSCSHAFSREATMSRTSASPRPIQQQQRFSNLESSTVLQQSTVVLPADFAEERPGFNLLQKIQRRIRYGESSAAMMEVPTTSSTSFLQKHPFVAAVSITTVNAILADVLTQLVFDASGPFNPKRSLVFGAFGMLYQGMVQYCIVNLVWEKVFPGNSPKAILSKICAMNLLSDPLFFMPTFYLFQEVMTSGSFGLVSIKAALMAYQGNCLMDWKNSWMVWFPGHAITYGAMPSHKRIPWMAFLGFFYMVILSVTRGGV